ncbi:hypothetical protein AV530_005946 [Patagioenas fasciata monilis]|uniref:Uncharacterized protein n=1 Tax=Patagioenas fasciata monilis TaxID=372326 RepID=A0A1V4JN62_PATFA|nr:hypothetical protein AV530_005946 [Patagioenas fasciata monilis]
MPAGSKMDPPLAKVEPISRSGSASEINYIRRGKACCTTANEAEEKSKDNVTEMALQTPKAVKKEWQRGRRSSRCWMRDSPAAFDVDHGEASCSPAAHRGP